MNEAIRIALQPHLNDAKLNLRFNVPRARISDNTTHAILRIIRELATNAINHGHATKIDIAGTIDGNRLMMSVRDNGVGFDPEKRPGVRECHFGLQGITERIQQFSGTMHIESARGSGTKVTLTLAHHLANDEIEAHT
ncbi:MAG: ATP-binding protein [Kiritimatiellae bacterium]|nr:ATP-binding protein [Kiritimatiellia bacterium]